MIGILASIATKLPLGMLERWLTHLEKKDDSDTVRLREILTELLETKKLQAKVIIAEQNNWYTAMIRPLIALPIIVYLWKTIVWDKVLQWGTTDPLGTELYWVLTSVVTAYFLMRPFEKNNMVNKAKELVDKWKK